MSFQPYNSNISFSRNSHSFVLGTATAKKTRGSTQNKAMAALKSHSDAERRRRERINSNLDALRRILPLTGSGGREMDKASLLAEVIRQVKELKQTAIEASKGLVIPTDADEVKVEAFPVDDSFSFKATLCCGFQQNLLSQVRQAVEEIPVTLSKVEICTVGGRLKTELLFTEKSCSGKDGKSDELMIHHALSSVLEKTFASSVEYLPRCTNPNKRRRVSSSKSCISSIS